MVLRVESEMDIQIHTLESLQSDGDEQSGLYASLCSAYLLLLLPHFKEVILLF